MLRRGMMAQAAGGGGGSDPYWANVVSLLHFDGTDASTTYPDEKGLSWANVGASVVSLSTTTPKFGTACLSITSGWISRASVAGDNFGTGDFTIEMQRRFTSTARQYLYSNNANAAAIIFTPSSGLLEVYGPGSFVINSGSTPLTTGVWRHFALTRQGNTWRFFIDGVLYQSVTDSRSWGSSAGSCYIAAPNSNTGAAVGDFDEHRVTKGVARYTANFTPPTAPFPNS